MRIPKIKKIKDGDPDKYSHFSSQEYNYRIGYLRKDGGSEYTYSKTFKGAIISWLLLVIYEIEKWLRIKSYTNPEWS